ncbi:copper-binding protein [Roseobacter sp. HKCCD9010]|uniref:copper-binding protein n=1 Tax=unclassified Roseobacter TaxID=196798 RepID=UPI001490935B|nr:MULTISPECIES: copper-binding protein [unclassified Roseobacter]MBF9049803.1 copper-binding protein [Rhodobacterales bacterium HKCCD4356]NNY41264.1 copper-binding protein [Roseobacter sp. HKCCD8831]NNV13658.1 copper-binding protein [Roseobacter sp. HKCCD7357]NNV16492.1 copper-binding protein [Roseobacter sp. HKCCD8768]NNV25951.1 copper-binding protein [Roseobacter sp. HKCCD8192]
MTSPVLSRRAILKGAAAIPVALIPSLTSADQPEIYEIEISSFAFQPEVVRVRIGDTIRWINRDLAPHTATADEFSWNTETLEQNEAGDILVTEGMETSYFCVFHPHMKGRIEIVTD